MRQKKGNEERMKKKGFVCLCAASVLFGHCMTAPPVFAADYSFIQKMEPLLYDTKFQSELAANKSVQKGEPDVRWFEPGDPRQEYEISTAEQLLGLAQLINTREFGWNGVNDDYTFKGITIRLTTDIKLTGDWTPAGSIDGHAFEGTFDGNGHTISGLNIDSADENQALFGYLKGTVENLQLRGSVNTTGNYAAGFAGAMAETAIIRNCTAYVNVTGKDKVGGIAGENYSGLITGCYNSGNIQGNVKVGGIAGENWNGIIRNCGNEGQVVSSGKGVGTYGTGGIAGRSVAGDAVIAGSFNKGSVSSENECTGGIAGYTNAQGSLIEDCYNTGAVTGPRTPATGYAGGIAGSIGEHGVILRDCYNAGTVKNGKYAGGILGNYTADSDQKPETYITNNYYLDGSAPLAIGKETGSGGKRNYPDAINVKSSADLRSTHMSSILGNAYRSDTLGMHGMNNGFPVLKWQKEIAINRDELLKKLTIPYQKEFRLFLKKYPYGTSSGDLLLKACNPQIFFEELILDLSRRQEEENSRKTNHRNGSERYAK